MQDIDFDEIDRAVSSATTPDSTSAKEETPVQTPPTTPPAARRSTGRFMDVVHASSDMRPATTRSSTPMTPTAPRETTAPVVPVEQEEEKEPPVNSGEAFHWPDPIDLHEDSTPKEPVVEAPTEPEQTATPTEETSAPLESPFLSDAKVEKRPLGAFSDPDPELLTPEDFPSSQTQTPEPTPEPETPQNHEEPAQVPVELYEDLLKLEANTEDEPVEKHDTASSEPEDIPVGPTSITQQYKEQPSSANEPSGAIFDTEVYNQALVHTPQKNKKVLIIVWIIALILVGGGVGAGIYFVLLPMFS